MPRVSFGCLPIPGTHKPRRGILHTAAPQALQQLPAIALAVLRLPAMFWLCCALHDLTLGCLPAGTPSKRGPLSSLWRDVKVMMLQPIFVLNLLAYCPVQGAFGAYTYWGPQVGCCSLNLSPCTQRLRVAGSPGVIALLTADKPSRGRWCCCMRRIAESLTCQGVAVCLMLKPSACRLPASCST